MNKIGVKPLLDDVKTLVELFGPFDMIPAPDAELTDSAEEWKGTWDESYVVPAALSASADRIDYLKAAKSSGGVVWERPTSKSQLDDESDLNAMSHHHHHQDDDVKRQDVTKTLAWLSARGVGALVDFNIEGDAGGEDSQVQSLWLYQTSGGLPSKEYYEEKPILDLYTGVVKDILIDLGSHLESKVEKRGLPTDAVKIAEEAIQGWPWPWPGDDDKGGHDGDDDGGDDDETPPHGKDEPIESRLGRLAEKVVAFERELIRAGADPEYLFNPHFAYNPYPTEKVSKHLPFLDIGTYLSSFAIRSFPKTITVTHPPYLKSVTKLVNSTPDYVLSGYFVTRLALAYSTSLGPEVKVRTYTRRLEEALGGIKKGTEEKRQDVCLNWVDSIVGYIAGREFVQEAFSPAAKKDGEDIINGK